MKNKFEIIFEMIMNEVSADKTCELCGKSIGKAEAELSFDYPEQDIEYDLICYDCAEKLANEYADSVKNGDAEITDNNKRSYYELWKNCESCGALVPESELKTTNVGDLCTYCIDANVSRGEHISIEY
jgi:hypothetical protein